jgi:hypothetical protein
MQRMLRNLVASAACGVLLTAASGLSALALETPTTGQPGAPANTCGPSNPVTPGNSANASGSPFNSSGQAGNVYAGNPGTASLANSNSTATVSQYDTACVRLSAH